MSIESLFSKYGFWAASFGKDVSDSFLAYFKINLDEQTYVCYNVRENTAYFIIHFLSLKKSKDPSAQFSHEIFSSLASDELRRSYAIFISDILKKQNFVKHSVKLKFAILVDEMSNSTAKELKKFCEETGVLMMENSPLKKVA